MEGGQKKVASWPAEEVESIAGDNHIEASPAPHSSEREQPLEDEGIV